MFYYDWFYCLGLVLFEYGVVEGGLGYFDGFFIDLFFEGGKFCGVKGYLC